MSVLKNASTSLRSVFLVRQQACRTLCYAAFHSAAGREAGAAEKTARILPGNKLFTQERYASLRQGELPIRHNYASDVEAGVNRQINGFLQASYTYLCMATYCDRPDVALPNVAQWMKKKYEFKRENALKLIKYQNMRGGFVTFDAVAKPSQDQWSGALEMFQIALAAELESNEALLDLHKTADRQKDPQLCDELEDYFLRPSVELIEELGRIVTNLRRVGNGVGEFVFDTHFFANNTSV